MTKGRRGLFFMGFYLFSSEERFISQIGIEVEGNTENSLFANRFNVVEGTCVFLNGLCDNSKASYNRVTQKLCTIIMV